VTDSIDGAVIVIAKTPHPGRVKTRLVPPLTPQESAEVAWACLSDTLDAVARTAARRRVLLLDGEPGSWIPDGFEVITQRGNGLADRLVAGFDDVDDDAVLIAMDTPQVRPAQLDRALQTLRTSAQAVLGRSPDGGFWLLGLRRGIPAATVLDGVPMSTTHTGAAQFRRLQELGVSVTLLEELRDIDTIDDVLAVAELIPSSATAQLAARLTSRDDHAAPSKIGGLLDEIRSSLRRVHPDEFRSEIERGALVVDTRPIEQRDTHRRR